MSYNQRIISLFPARKAASNSAEENCKNRLRGQTAARNPLTHGFVKNPASQGKENILTR